MASSTPQPPCKECPKGVARCTGCGKQYCINHFQKHRQELTARMDEVGQQHDELLRYLEQENCVSELTSRIEDWKEKSLKQIEETAKRAQEDVQKCFDRTKHRLKESLHKLTEKVKSSQASDNYAEKELDEWMKSLFQMREMLQKSSTIDIVEDDKISTSIRLIKVIDRSMLTTATTSNSYTKLMTMDEVKQLAKQSDRCIVVINKRVYDITKFLDEHPGGEEILQEQNGTDASHAFEDVGHSSDAREQLAAYEIARLQTAEHQFSAK